MRVLGAPFEPHSITLLLQLQVVDFAEDEKPYLKPIFDGGQQLYDDYLELWELEGKPAAEVRKHHSYTPAVWPYVTSASQLTTPDLMMSIYVQMPPFPVPTFTSTPYRVRPRHLTTEVCVHCMLACVGLVRHLSIMSLPC
jgi:hypothetical protein